MGVTSSTPVFNWYLKKDLREDNLRLMVLADKPASFRKTSQLRVMADEMSAMAVSPNCSSIKSKNCTRSSWYERIVWEEYLFSNRRLLRKGCMSVCNWPGIKQVSRKSIRLCS